MNIYDISKKAGVSIATVSRVLNGNEKVSEKTRQKILAVMEEAGYKPNAFARGLGLNTMKTVGILCANSSDAYLASAVYFMERELRKNDYNSILCCCGYELEDKQKYLELLLSKRVDAVVLAGSNFVESAPEKNKYILAAADKVPIIILNGYLAAENVYCSLCDDKEATSRVTGRLLETGRKNLLYLCRAFSYSGQKKIEGFRQAFAEKNMKLEEDQIQIFNGSIPEVKEMLSELSDRGVVFDGVLASDDELAIGALKYAKEKGLSVPGDLALVGYNNSKMGICCDPELTSIDNKLEFSCINAATVLMKVLEGSPVPSKTLFSADVVERGTTDIFAVRT